MPNRGLHKRLLSNWPAKVLSLAAALLLFFFYKLNRLEDRYISVPLAVSLNDEYLPSSQYPRTVRLTLRGETNALFTIQEDDVRASLDLSDYRAEGQYRAPVQIERKGTALGVDPLEIRADPAAVSVAMERRVTRVVPVTPSFKGFLEPGYELLSFDLKPAEISVSGPASAVARVDDVQTDFIELAGRNSDFTVKTRVLKKESLVAISGSDSVEFRAIVQRSLAIKSFEGIAISGEGLPGELALAVPLPAGSLRVRSSTTDISVFSPAQGILFVDLSLLRKAGTYEVKVQARSPDGFTIERYEPQAIQVTIVAAGNFPTAGGYSPGGGGR
jgi:YbbR domain-containing protein